MSSLLSTLLGPLATTAAAAPAAPGAPVVDPHTADFGTVPLAAADQLFIVEAVIVIVFSRILSYILSKIKQPSVIAEVISGIILGPTVMGRIPGFMNTIFPDKALPIFNVIANLGLIFFMNLIGLELDFELMVSGWKRTTVISVATMVIPFAVSIGSSYAVWDAIDKPFIDTQTKKASFGTYMLFMGVAMCVTAFPVLARIVKEKNLFSTRIGVTTLSSAAWADVVAWTLLALSISLISGGSKYNILWTFLSLIAFAIIMFGPVRWGLRKLIIKKGKPIDITPTIFAMIIVATLACSWITAYVGLHSIFGAFIFGIILPRDGKFTVHLAEKFEDFVTAFFLPLYFTASGLKTQLGLLKDFNTWGLLLLLVSVAIITKIASGMFSARLTGLSWRESFTLGVLMNTKGLVELIVLNIGLENKLISPTTFSMMVVLALITTFITSPIVHYAYPYYRIVEFENQIPGKTVLVTAINDRADAGAITGIFALVASPRPKKYRMRAVHTQALQDRPSAYMMGAHEDEILDHLRDSALVVGLRVKTVPLTNDDTDRQLIEQLASASASFSANFFFTVWHVPVWGDEIEYDTDLLDSDATLGGSLVRKIYSEPNFTGHLAVIINRGVPSNLKRVTFIYSGSNHDIHAVKLVKAMLHSPNAHITVVYAMHSLVHKQKISTAQESHDPILKSLFRKNRAAKIDLMVVHEENITMGVCNAINSLEDPGLVVCGSDLTIGEPSTNAGILYREIFLTTECSFLVISKGRSHNTLEADDSDMNTMDTTRVSVSIDNPRRSFEMQVRPTTAMNGRKVDASTADLPPIPEDVMSSSEDSERQDAIHQSSSSSSSSSNSGSDANV